MTKPRYYPTYTGNDPAVTQELERLSAILGDPGVEVPIAYQEPAKPRDGFIVRADGAQWDPLGLGVESLVMYSETAADWVALGTGGSGGTGTSDHGSLEGLLDDDHPQYLTRTRGDALYYPLEFGTEQAGAITEITESIATLQEGTQEIIADLLALTPRVDSLETIQAQHTQDISDLTNTYGDTVSAAQSAADAAAAALAAAQSAAAALADADDAQTFRDAAEAAKTSAESAASTASGAATTAINAASSATTSENNAASSATSALNYAATAESWANAAQDAVASGITIDAAPGALWKFDSDLESWTGSNPTPTWDSNGYLNQGGGSDPTLQSPSISVVGADYMHISFRVRRNSGSGWQGRFRYSTSGHGFSASYEKVISEPLFVGTNWMVVNVDMSTITDWNTSTITGIQLELGSDGGTSDFDLDWIGVGNSVVALANAAAQSAQEAATYADDAQTYAGAANSSAASAQAQAANSALSASAAATSAQQAGASASASSQSASAANVSKVAAETARSGAESAQAAAVTAKNNAEAAESQASTYSINAANSATDAGNSATAAQASATNAQSYADDAQASADSASVSADQAATSAGSSGNSASAAAISAQSAQSSSSQAGIYASAAQGHATTAQSSASQASSYAGQASTASDAAAQSAVDASTSAQTAGNAAATATTQASNASQSASEASASAALAAAYRFQVIPVNPLNINGDKSRWYNVASVALQNVGGRLGYMGLMQSAANLAAYTEWLELDPAAIYEVRLSVLKSTLKGRFYVGLQGSTDGVNANASIQPVRNQVTVDSPTTAPYWIQTQLDTGWDEGLWYDLVLYIVGSAVSVAQCPDAYCNGQELTSFPWSQEYHGLQMPSGARFGRLRLLNYDNAGTTTNLYATNVFVTRIDNQNTAALKVEQTVRAGAIDGLSQQYTSLSTRVGDNEASIVELFQTTDGIEAKWAVKVDVNGRVAGVELIATGYESAFAIYADKFFVAIPGAPGSPPKVPFIVGNVGGVSTVGIDGNLLVNGSVKAQAIYTPYLSALSADLGAVTAGTIVMSDTSSWIRFGNAFGSTAPPVDTSGIWLGTNIYGPGMFLGSTNEHLRYYNGQLIVKARFEPQTMIAFAHGSFNGNEFTTGFNPSAKYPTTLSVSRSGTGVYTVSGFSAPNSNYTVVVSGWKTQGNVNDVGHLQVVNKGTTSFQVIGRGNGGSASDFYQIDFVMYVYSTSPTGSPSA